MKKVLIYLLVSFSFFTCKKDRLYPIEVTFKGIELEEVKVLVKENGNKAFLTPEETQLSMASQFQQIEKEGIFESFVFKSDSEAEYTFDKSFTIDPKPISFIYSFEDEKLTFDTNFGAATNFDLELEGSTADFSMASEAVLIKQNKGRVEFFP